MRRERYKGGERESASERAAQTEKGEEEEDIRL